MVSALKIQNKIPPPPKKKTKTARQIQHMILQYAKKRNVHFGLISGPFCPVKPKTRILSKSTYPIFNLYAVVT